MRGLMRCATLQRIELPERALVEMDASLAQLSFNRSMLPWKAQNPMTHAHRMNMHATIQWGMQWAEYQIRGRWPNRDTERILRKYLGFVRDLHRPEVTLNQCEKLALQVAEALSELETIIPPT